MDQEKLPCVNSEYNAMKKSLYQKFFKDFARISVVLFILEIFRSIFLGEYDLLSDTLQIFSILFIVTVLILRTGKYQEKLMTIYFLAFYIGVIITHTSEESVYMQKVPQAFNYACNNTFLAAAIVNRIPRFEHRVFYKICIAIARILIIPVEDKSYLFIDALFLSFSIYFDYDRERHDEKLFDSSFFSREQLQRFKDLVVGDIPDSIAIINQELNQCLFGNNSFTKLFEGSHDRSIRTCLSKFSIQESLSEASLLSEQSAGSPVEKQTLLMFLYSHLRQEEDRINFTRTSCNVSFKKSMGLEAHNSFEKIHNPSEYSFDVKILPLIWDEKPAIGIILHDITQQNTILRLKVAANIQKDRILATVSHELRTPLNSIIGMIQIMKQKIADKEVLEYLDICNNSGYLLLSLVNSILDMNMIKANKLKLNPERIFVKDFLEEMTRLFSFQCIQKKIQLKFYVSSVVPKIIVTDKNRLSQIFINLIGNAVKFTQEGEIKVSIDPYKDDTRNILISVEDTGIGIKEEDRNKLFRMFGKLDYQETVVNTQGVGLGLTISNNLSKLLCRSKDIAGIQLQTEYKKGSKFYFVIDKTLGMPNSSSFSRKELEILNTSSDFPLNGLDEGEVDSKQLDDYLSPQPSPKKKLSFKLNESSLYSRFARHDVGTRNSNISGSSSPVREGIMKRKFFGTDIVKNYQIVVVDDNPLNLKVAELFLKTHNYQAKPILSGRQAIEFLIENDYSLNPIQLIFMDLQMPEMDGYQATRKLKEMMRSKKIPEIPIVALTANTSDNDKKACLKSGMADHLGKPLREEDLQRVLRKYS